MTTVERLTALCELSGPSGFEHPVSRKAAELLGVPFETEGKSFAGEIL